MNLLNAARTSGETVVAVNGNWSKVRGVSSGKRKVFTVGRI